MEREAVSQAFSGLIAGTNATSDKIEFIELIVSELTANGANLGAIRSGDSATAGWVLALAK